MQLPSIDPQPRAGSMPRLRVFDATDFEIRHHALPASSPLEGAFGALARRAAPGCDPRIVDARLRRYEWAITASRGGRLRAFLLGQTRSIAGECFVYFGPLYSVQGAFLPLFAHALKSVCALAAPWWIVAEIEHPRLRPLFTHLVPSSWPRPRVNTPREVSDAAQALAGALGHVHELDPRTLRTTCEDAPAQLVVVRAQSAGAASAIARDLEDAVDACRAARHRRLAVAS
jgi:hypothetical protein